MKRQGTSKFVTELITNWLKEVRNPAVLDDFEKLIKERRAMLMIETQDECNANLIDALTRCKHGDKLYLTQPLPKVLRKFEADDNIKYREAVNRMTCTFYAYQPRKKLLWVSVPWRTANTDKRGNYIRMKHHDIFRCQPSRTEVELRPHVSGGKI